MALSARERTRYARHLLLPEIGVAGQELLLATRAEVALSSDPGAAEVSAIYLERAGLELDESESVTGPQGPSSAVAELSGRTVRVCLPSPQEIAHIAGGQPELIPAAQALVGALAAVEAIKVSLVLGRPSHALNEVRLLPEDV